MHNPFYNTTSGDLIQVNHLNIGASEILPTTINQIKLSDIIKNKINNNEYFYGIEISSKSINNRQNSILNYNLFHIQPLFTSIIWIGEIYANILPIKDIPAIKCAKNIKKSNIVMPHLTCYHMTYDKIQEILTDDITNVLALRGDKVDENQNYKHAIDLVKEIRNIKGDKISVGVGGYPEGHPNSASFEEDLDYLKAKVDAGADFIITQLCFSETNIKNFILECRKKNILIPIIPGIYIPENFQSLIKMINITKVKIPENLYEKYENLKNDNDKFKIFAQENAIKMIKNLFKSNLKIYGIQFFTLNYFESISKVVNELFLEL